MNFDDILPPKETHKHRWVTVALISITAEEAVSASAGIETTTSSDKIATGPVSCFDCHYPYEVAYYVRCPA